MEEKRIELLAAILKTEELSPDDNRLRMAAVHAAGRAYAPYSRFQVGAAVMLRDGSVVEGSNQENIAFPSGLCAERVALFHAGASFPEIPVISLAIVAVKDGVIQKSIAPCGACRQVMLETEQRYGKPVRILMCGRDETILVSTAKDLLPFGFSGI
ncbi:MAG TPA: cytidine deaminase [Porphyromonadaceae bacterium]|nr:cytidine deaminase [Porphyromonadaceae bacterium]